ncbi:MAG: 2-oxo acid dehydrogenase subunit E2 [Anaerolineae bacterium]|nr:2-oxo acid dehydrogenase subunit E2 [Anaerolineae bacterium]
MATPIIMPKFEMTQENATVVRWLIQAGDTIEQGDPIMEVETDKVVMEVEAPASGVLGGVKVQKGDVIPVTEVIAYILQPGEALPQETGVAPILPEQPGQPPPATPSNGPSTIRATPLALRLAAEAGIEISQVSPSDTTDRVTRQDVKNHLARVAAVAAGNRPRATPSARRMARDHGLNLAQIQGSGPQGRIQKADVQAAVETAHPPATPEVMPITTPEVGEVIPLAGMRRTIATRMQQSYQTVPHINLTVEVDMTAAETLRQELNTEAEKLGQPRISLTAILVKVCAWALKRHPGVNASLRDDTIYLHHTANIGVAVALPDGKGLIVPVIREAEKLGLAEIAGQMKDLFDRARAGRLVSGDVIGGTFTITNLGMFGVDHFTAIINPPESAILAVGRTTKRPVVMETERGDEVVIRPMMKMTLALDHRVLDGAAGAQFLQDVVKTLEQPSLLLW